MMSSVNSESQTEHIKQLISGLASMNISQEKLKEELRKAKSIWREALNMEGGTLA